MNNVDLCLNEANNVIPCEILNAVFADPELSTREKLKLEVWDKIVLLDLDAYGGERIEVDLGDLPYSTNVYNSKVYRNYLIPRSRTRDKVITSVLNIVHTPPIIAPAIQSIAYGHNNPADNAIQRAYGAVDANYTYFVSEIKLLGTNLVTGHFPYLGMLPDSFKMECIVQNDETANNMDIKSMNWVVDLFVVAVKRYIYRNLKIQLDQGQAIGGHEIGAYVDVVNSYESAEEEYRELRHKIGFQSTFSNPRNRLKIFRSCIGAVR